MGSSLTPVLCTGEHNLWGSNHVYRNPILNYYMGSRVLVFDPENPTEIIEEHLDFDTFPMFSASRKYICDFVVNSLAIMTLEIY